VSEGWGAARGEGLINFEPEGLEFILQCGFCVCVCGGGDL